MKIPDPGKGDEPEKPKEGSGVPGADADAQKSAHALPEAFNAQAQPPNPSELKAFIPLLEPSTPSANSRRDPLGLDLCNKQHILILQESFFPGDSVSLAEAYGWWQQEKKGPKTEHPDPDLEDPNVLAKMRHRDRRSVIIPKSFHGPVLIAEILTKLHIPTMAWPEGLADFYEEFKNIPDVEEEDFL